jgi:hypothetical protein
MNKLVLSLTLCFLTSLVFAQPYQGLDSKKVKIPAKAAGCVPPTSTTRMELNNVRMLVHTAGNLWQVPGQNLSMYEVPKNSGIMALFTSALWLGGTDANGQLKLAALRYRNGQDYWTGPLTETSATTTPENCQKYDKHFVSSQDEIRNFNAWYETGIADAENGTNEQAEKFPDYKIPDIVKDWPAHGDVSIGQDFYLAPFYDFNKDGVYNYLDGDYPWHDIKKEKDCQVDRRVSLYGDLNYWWVMNDKGNIHTETGADPIGMEIRAQAFCFASNDEINNMTFYNYELINRGSLTLFDTYFGFFTDGALGGPYDDYVGCDVSRGLAYYYNGNSFDADNGGFKGYGENPPAVGVDFFEGPYQDNDGIDNAFGIGPKEALNGIGFGDGIVDNERFGMRRFLYYSNTTNGADPSQTDPVKSSDYYNYLQGRWKDGSPFYYGGSGHISDADADPNTPCDFMFPGDTDPLGWGTGGNPQPSWTEQSSGNVPNDRRFVQSAGPFLLKPGAINNITVGVVYARGIGGDPFASVEVLRRADDKAQSLFENCFKIIDAPHAPDLVVQELENELILFISNPLNSNNYKEQYIEFDPFIVAKDPAADKNYRFQGYQIFQLVSEAVSSSDLSNVTKARLVAQCDLEDGVNKIVNFNFDEELQATYPVVMVDGEDKGISHSFRITEDQFAQGERTLVNFKRYYYMAVAYAYNNFETYIPDDPLALEGQKKSYLQSRKGPIGEVRVVEAIPHHPRPEAGGTYTSLAYGSSPKIKRLTGTGNGGRFLDFTEETKSEILKNSYSENPVYKSGFGPIDVKVVDPLNLADGYFECLFINYNKPNDNGADTANWVINRYQDENKTVLLESVASELSIESNNEQIIPRWGVSVRIRQKKYSAYEGGTGAISEENTTLIDASINFADSSKQWLTFVNDRSGNTALNWIRSGAFLPDPNDDPFVPANIHNNPLCYADQEYDEKVLWSGILGGGWAPHALVGYQCDFMPLAYYSNSPKYPNNVELAPSARKLAGLAYTPSVDVVVTSDQSKWTRCPVLELGRDPSLNVGQAKTGARRKSQSVNKEGKADGSGTFGMGWFPGYALDLESGVRLQMAFGENSFLANDGGSDMIWNPSNRVFDQVGSPVLGGMQPIYIFAYKQKSVNGLSQQADLGYYDESASELNSILEEMESTGGAAIREFYSSLAWVGYPLLSPGQKFMSTDVTMKLRVSKEYKTGFILGENEGRPAYSWSMKDFATRSGERNALAEALDLINVVPNPYYGNSDYERSKIDTRVKITNLPELCYIKIYQANGKLVKSFKKDAAETYQDWTLNNEVGIPVSSGIYLIHIEVPGIGDKVVKLYLAQRQVDLHGF